MSDLRDRLARLMANAVPFGVCRGGWSLLGRYERKQWQRIADALLDSEEWQAREAVADAAGDYADLGRLVHEREDELGPVLAENLIRLGHLRGALFSALARLAAVRRRT